MHIIDLLNVEDGIGFIIPKSILDFYNLKIGDDFELIEENNGFKLIPIDKSWKSADSVQL